MKKNLLILLCAFTIGVNALQAQTELYVNNVETGFFYNPGLDTNNNPLITLDDINVPSSVYAGSDSMEINKIIFGISRQQLAPSVTLKYYYSTVKRNANDTDRLCSIPPIFIDSTRLSQNGLDPVTEYITVGDGINPLFKVRVDSGYLVPDAAQFFLGVSVSKTGPLQSGWSLADGSQSPHYDAFWLTDGNAISSIRLNTVVGTDTVPFPAVFNVQVFGKPSILPVTFLSFNGVIQNNNALLNWSTATENNNKGFFIERSADGRNFSSIGFVNGSGTSTQINKYAYTDAELSKLSFSVAYYRLKQVDFDGKTHYSGVVKLDLNKLFSWNIYPNPIENEGWVQLHISNSSKVSLQVVSANGKIIQAIDKGILAEGSYSIPLNLSKASKGTYFVRLSVNKETYIKTIAR